MFRRITITFVLLIMAMLFVSLTKAQEAVPRIALVLGIDGSLSTTLYRRGEPTSFEVEVAGHSAAFRSGAVHNIIRNFPGGIAVAAVVWSGNSQQNLCVDFTVISNVEESLAFADAVLRCSPIGGVTEYAGVLRFATDLIEREYPNAWWRVIDLSADQPSRSPFQAERMAADNVGITINAIALEEKLEESFSTYEGDGPGQPKGPTPAYATLRGYHEATLITGPGAFAVAASPSSFKEVILYKIAKEMNIALTRTPPGRQWAQAQ